MCNWSDCLKKFPTRARSKTNNSGALVVREFLFPRPDTAHPSDVRGSVLLQDSRTRGEGRTKIFPPRDVGLHCTSMGSPRPSSPVLSSTDFSIGPNPTQKEFRILRNSEG